jgi:DNA-binding beta-propeller fold protein YncE
MFSSHDGRYLYVSRPSLADVVGIDLATEKIVWRVKVEGYRSDHMAISPDGRHVLVSASTARKVHVIDVQRGEIVGEFESGDQPHENNYSADGSRVFHASIGTVYTPADDPSMDETKGDRWFQIVDARTNEVLRRIDMGQKLEEAGYPDMSSAVRPMALSPDERYVYFQVSFFHGFVEYDLVEDRVLRLAELPISEEAKRKRREEYLLDSAHHGLAMNPAGTKLCVAGTMSDYAAIVDRDTFDWTIAASGVKPYWSTNNGDGNLCFVSFSGDDAVSVISYDSEREIARIPVGDHPQRMRMGKLASGLLGTRRAARPRLVLAAAPRRFRARRRAVVRAVVTVRRNGELIPVRGVRLILAGARATTNARGRARLRKRRGFARRGTYRLRARHPHYRGTSLRIRVLPRRRR